MGEPGALVNDDCCDAFEGVLPEGQEMKNEVQEAASNKLNRPKRLIVVDIFSAEITPVSSRLGFKTFRRHSFFRRV